MITATGWTWEYIDNHMTIPRLQAMRSYWEIAPPTHLALNRLNSALLKPASGSGNKGRTIDHGSNERGSLQDLITEFGMAGGDMKA